MSAKYCECCKVVFPETNDAGNPPPEACPKCGNNLAEYTGAFKKAKPKGDLDLTVEFTEDVGEAQRRQVIQALQSTQQVKRTPISELKPPEDVYLKE